MGLWKMFKEDMNALVPESIKILTDDKNGEYAFEIVNKPNRHVPRVVRNYENTKRKISFYEAIEDGKTDFWSRVKQEKIGHKNPKLIK